MADKNTIELIKNLIRYDIPVLLLGKPSLKKSFTITELATIFNIPYQLLHIGSEKSEYIEGLPKITSEKDTIKYFKPYWFPDAGLITIYVKKGKSMLEDFAKRYNKEFKYSYENLSGLLNLLGEYEFPEGVTELEIELKDKNSKLGEKDTSLNKPFTFVRTLEESKTEYKRNDLRDICLYLSTILGYGNFWLILDVIDKVNNQNANKYAPLLRIIEDRSINDYNLREINNRRGIKIYKEVSDSDYTKIKDIVDDNLSKGNDVLDARIMATASDSSIIEDDIFTNFIQVTIDNIILLNPASKEVEEIRQCISDKNIPSDLSDFEIKLLKDADNLLWQLDFLVKILNKKDSSGNLIRSNYIEEKEKTETLLYKILKDNFLGENLVNSLFECLGNQIEEKKETTKVETENIRNIISGMSESGLNITDMKGEIINNLSVSYPSNVLDKVSAVKQWANNSLMYIEASMFDKSGKYGAMPELSAVLIPSIQKLIIEKITLDPSLTTENIASVIRVVDSFWTEVLDKVSVSKLSADAEETQTAIYGGVKEKIISVRDEEKIRLSENSLFGADYLVISADESVQAEAYRNSLSYKIAMKQTEGLKLLIETLASNDKLDTLNNEPELLKFIKDNHGSTLNSLDLELRSSNPELAIRIKTFFDL